MRRVIASWAVLAFLVVNVHLTIAHAFASASVGEHGSSTIGEISASEHTAGHCQNHQNDFESAAADNTDDDHRSGIACKVACMAIADFNVPIPIFLKQRLESSAFVLTKLPRWHSIDHRPLIRPPFIG